MRRSLLLIAAVFAAGLGLGYVLKPVPPPDRAARTAPAAPAPAETVGVDSAPGAMTPRPEPLPDMPRGHGRIRGRVVDDAGAPLKGALVLATPVEPPRQRKWPKGVAGPLDRDLDEISGEMVARERWRRDGRRTARTGADGAYELTGLGPVKWNLQAYKEGYELHPSSGAAYGAEPGAAVDFAGGRVVRVDVDVRLPDGARPLSANIQVRARTANSTLNTTETWLAAEPWIELPAKTCELTATAESATSQPQTVTIDPDRVQPLVFQLEERPGLRVTVIPPEDLPKLSPHVMAMRFTGAKPPDPARLRREGMRRSPGRRENETLWQDLEPGSYLIGAACSYDAPVTVTKVVQVGAGKAEHELRLPPVDPKDYLTIRVRDPDGSSALGVRFTLVYRSPYSVNALARADDAYLILRPSSGDPEGGTRHTIIAEGALGRIEQAYDPSDTKEILLQFESPAFLDVTIPGYARSPHAGWLSLYLAARDDKDRAKRCDDTKPQPQGTCRLGPVQPGSYDLVLRAVPELWKVSVVPLDLRSGVQTATIDVPPLHALTVRWPGKGARSLSIQQTGGLGGSFERNLTEESTVLERMPKGHYRILRATPDQEHIEVDVPAQTEITIK